MRVQVLSAATLLLVSAVACGGRGPASPTAPSGLQTPPAATSGATIIGLVKGAGNPLLAASTGASASSLTVTVVGTNISAVVGSNGQFTLSGVPGGQIQLNFSGPGVNATLTLAVDSSETITLTLSIKGSEIEIESEGHNNHGDAEVNGIAQNVVLNSDGTFQFNVGMTLVKGDGNTDFFGDGDHPDTAADLQSGERVEVKGETRGDFVYAQRIHINDGNDADDDDDDEEEEVETEGKIDSIGGTAPNLILTLSNGATVHTSDATRIRRRHETLTFAALVPGIEIEAEGTQNAGGWIDAKKIQIEDEADDDDDDQDDDDNEVEAEGTLGNLGGGCPSITFTVNGTTAVETNASTQFKGAACGAFVDGVKVEVEGVMAGAVLRARKVKMED